MKLETSIPLRGDGTVVATGLDKKEYVFAPDPATGMVTCDIEHQETIAHLLGFDGFYPASEADHEAAAALIQQAGASGAGGSDDAGGGDDDGSDDDESNPNALPVEANTPPASIPKVNKVKPAAKKTAKASAK